MSATEWRDGGSERWRERRAKERNGGKTNRKDCKVTQQMARHTVPESIEESAMSLRIEDLPTYRVAYMRYVGPYGAHGIPDLWQRFYKWTHAHRLSSPEQIMLGVAYDNPNVAAPDRCRYDACAVVPEEFQADRQVDVTDVGGGPYAMYDFTGTSDEISSAWDRTFDTLPDSGYVPDDRPCIEVYRGDCSVAGEPGRFRCELCLPVRPL
jgi:AraC family transcriptional regulator